MPLSKSDVSLAVESQDGQVLLLNFAVGRSTLLRFENDWKLICDIIGTKGRKSREAAAKYTMLQVWHDEQKTMEHPMLVAAPTIGNIRSTLTALAAEGPFFFHETAHGYYAAPEVISFNLLKCSEIASLHGEEPPPRRGRISSKSGVKAVPAGLYTNIGTVRINWRGGEIDLLRVTAGRVSETMDAMRPAMRRTEIHEEHHDHRTSPGLPVMKVNSRA